MRGSEFRGAVRTADCLDRNRRETKATRLVGGVCRWRRLLFALEAIEGAHEDENRERDDEETEDVVHEDAVDVDNLLTFNIKGNDINYLEKHGLDEGIEIIVQYGYIGRKKSAKYLARVTDLTTTYSKTVDIKI